MTPIIRIFMTVYHRPYLFWKCFDSLMRTWKASPEEPVDLVIIVNGADPKFTDELKALPKSHPNVRVDFMEKNVGKTDATNRISKRYPDFAYFIGCDQDIGFDSVAPGWPTLLRICFDKLGNSAGMLSTNYIQNGNHPMPRQPSKEEFTVSGCGKYDGKYTFSYGGQVAGGCFLTSKWVWDHTGYKSTGVYGGVDGLFRMRVANECKKKCGYIEEVVVEHLWDERDKDYYDWKIKIQRNLKEKGMLKCSDELGNTKGFFDL